MLDVGLIICFAADFSIVSLIFFSGFGGKNSVLKFVVCSLIVQMKNLIVGC